jgi:hypothetical protein
MSREAPYPPKLPLPPLGRVEAPRLADGRSPPPNELDGRVLALAPAPPAGRVLALAPPPPAGRVLAPPPGRVLGRFPAAPVPPPGREGCVDGR